jgi:hypothetical protein
MPVKLQCLVPQHNFGSSTHTYIRSSGPVWNKKSSGLTVAKLAAVRVLGRKTEMSWKFKKARENIHIIDGLLMRTWENCALFIFANKTSGLFDSNKRYRTALKHSAYPALTSVWSLVFSAGVRIRIKINADPNLESAQDPDNQKVKKIYSCNLFENTFLIKNCNLLIPRPP